MTEFKWSPGAIEAASVSLFGDAGRGRRHRNEMTKALDAAAKAQSVVAFPPCPTCRGTGNQSDEESWSEALGGPLPCPSCNGSCVERLIPESEIQSWISREWRRAARFGFGRRRAAVYETLDELVHFLRFRQWTS